MRPPLLVIALLASLALAATAPAMIVTEERAGAPAVAVLPQGGAGPVFVLTGGGFGHGVGMSQYGALAQAQAGRHYPDILAFYYPGTVLGTAPATTVRVLLASAARSLTISSDAPFSARDATGKRIELPAGPVTVGPDLQLPLSGLPTPLVGPLAFAPGAGRLLSVGGRPYRGTLQVTSTGAALQAVDLVGVEAYLQGVVPGEMPSTWPADALEAQAVAARSYALASLVPGRAWDLYADTRSQEYLGAAAETPQTTAAVRATDGRVLLFGGKVATAFYSSSSGGQTVSALDAFGLALPYLPSQTDPWDAASPFHVWQPRAYTGRQLAQALGLAAPVTDVQAQLSTSGRVDSLVLTTAGGATVEVPGGEAGRRLALRSTDFRIGTLRLLPPAAPASPGTGVRLIGVARDVQGAVLEQLDPLGAWVPALRRLRVAPDGTFAALVRPLGTTTYRLSAVGLAGPALTVPVGSGTTG